MSLASLLERMTSVQALAERPLGKSYLISSYDRKGGNVDWSIWTKTNPDGRITLLDVDGPGYVSRIWIASFYAERWLFFIDGETEPRLNLTQAELFGGKFPFEMPLAGNSGGGKFSLTPIPFAKHLRIDVVPRRLNPNDRNYFHINYTLLDNKKGAHESWPQQLTEAASSTLAAVRTSLMSYNQEMRSLASDLLSDSTQQSIAPGEKLSLFHTKEAGIIHSLALQLVTPGAEAQEHHDTLRSLRLQLFWDGVRQPSVDVPLGDFFCNTFYKREFSSLSLANIAGTYLCRFPMPFQKQARIVLINTGTTPATIRSGIRATDEKPDEDARYFHAKWAASATSGRPFTMGHPTGSGHYIGCLLTAIGQDGSWNILEGDEIIIPNDDRALAQHGTGLEDYFNGAYYYTSLFDLPFHGLIEKGAMRTDQYRFHALDAISFTDGLDVSIEFGDQNRAQGYMSSIIYWYGDQPEATTIAPEQQRLLARPPDRFALPGMMAQLFTLERAGLWSDAAARCRYYAHANRAQPWHSLLALRAEACKEFIEDAVPDYESFQNDPFQHTAAQARDLAWRQAKKSHALLGIHTRGNCKIWIDQQLVAETQGAESFVMRRLDLAPGAHTWEVEHEPTHQGSFFALFLRTAWGDITSAGPWGPVSVTPLPGREPPETYNGGQALPNMTVWQFQPNAFPAMQSPAHGVNTWSFWDSRPRIKKVRLRQAFTNGVTTQAGIPTEIKRSAAEERAHAID